MLFRYYCPYRPPMVGTIPRGMCNIVSFDERQHVPGTDKLAWGYAEYERPLTTHEIYAYELFPAPAEPETKCNGDYCEI